MNKFITFEGIDCCGKTTQIDLLSNYLLKNNQQSTIVREPGGTLISEKIRNILLDNNNFINSNTETLLFLSARSQLVNEIIAKSINNNFVLCDRYTDSTLAYQGYGRGISKNKIDILNEFATSGLNPDITFESCTFLILSITVGTDFPNFSDIELDDSLPESNKI